jgi:recombination protein RecA
MASPRPFSTGLPSPASDFWGLEPLAGRLVEISGHRASANLTVAFGLVLEAQNKDEPVAWVTLAQSTFFPPDAAESGIDLTRLAVVRVSNGTAACRATVELTRSGGFGLVVLDLGPGALQEIRLRPSGYGGTSPERFARRRELDKPAPRACPSAVVLTKAERLRKKRSSLSLPFITKLVGLAQKTSTAVVVLTEKTRESSSLNSLVSLRCEARRNPERPEEVEIDVLKDKRRGPGRRYREVCHAPAGLR